MNKVIFCESEKKLLKQYWLCYNQTDIIIRFMNSPKYIIEEYKIVRTRIINLKCTNLGGLFLKSVTTFSFY